MAQDFTTTGLLASVKRRGMLPSVGSGQGLDTADYLAFGTDELQTYVMDVLLSANQEYGVTNYDVSTVSGTSSYPVPARAMDEALRVVQLNDGNGNYVSLVAIPTEHVSDYATSGSVSGYYFKDNAVVLVPAPTSVATLRLQYFMRPSALVATSAAATISSINGGRTVVTTVGAVPSTFSSGVTLDVVNHNPGFRILVLDAATTGTVSGTTITFSVALPASVVAGNYVCLAGESPVPQLMPEAHPLLAQRIVVKSLEALGDKKVDGAMATCERMKKELLARLMPRTKGAIQYVVNRNGPGFGAGRGRGLTWVR